MASAFSGLLHSATPGGKRLLKFEIRLDEDFVVFRGPPDETPDGALKGSVVLMTGEPMQIKGGIRIKFEGRRRTQHYIQRNEVQNGHNASTVVLTKGKVLDEEIRLRDGNGQPIRQLAAGNHSFPFSFHLPGHIEESVEGLQGSFITYDLRAVCERGILAKDMSITKHVRIIRTIGPDALETGASAAVSGVWPDKIKYLFEPVSKNFIFGTTISTDLEMVPLIDKLSIEKVKFTLKEILKVKADPGPEYSPITKQHHGMWKEEHDVVIDSMDVPPDCAETDIDTQLPMYKFRANWQLPKSLKRLRQSVPDGEWIQISHQAHYDILLRNPDGHLSELKAHHPVRLFISPNLLIDDTNNVVVTPSEVAGSDIDPLNNAAPPVYGSHQLDMLVPFYDGIDPSGYLTPGLTSGAATPFRFGAHSRNASSENLLSTSAEAVNGHPNPNILSSRLRNLQMTDDRVVRQGRSGLSHSREYTPDQALTPQRSPSLERDRENHSNAVNAHGQANGEIPTMFLPDEEHVNYDMNALGRIPSYNTAVKSTARVGRSDATPTYATATSRPPSPLLQPPGRAHVRPGNSRLSSQ